MYKSKAFILSRTGKIQWSVCGLDFESLESKISSLKNDCSNDLIGSSFDYNFKHTYHANACSSFILNQQSSSPMVEINFSNMLT